MADVMRLDRFLWWVRLAKTRSAAQGIAAHGRLRIDGRAVDRSHVCVRIGMILTFAAHDRIRVVRVAALPTRRGPASEAQACYEDLATNTFSELGAQFETGRIDASGNAA